MPKKVKKVKKVKKSKGKPLAELTVYDDVCKIGDDCCKTKGGASPCAGAVYGLGFLGSAIYYVSTASGFWVGVWGIIKSLVWPAFLVFEALKFFGA